MKHKRYWHIEKNVILEAKKYKTLKEFYTNSKTAYYAALRLRIMNKITWFENKKINYEEKDTVYAYIFERLKYVYIGRTLMSRIDRRDKEHFSENKNEVTYRFIKNKKKKMI